MNKPPKTLKAAAKSGDGGFVIFLVLELLSPNVKRLSVCNRK